ncbi:unnamed protein product [Wuchereria bancrofti]|uniref:Uncharacterized protein n=1 Tax=Wuchereria bancrofti TaxID=6293 RepID=A0A3P7DTT8_WUCBA|nr:unnamed protein product [Wuchereria bancrofti]
MRSTLLSSLFRTKVHLSTLLVILPYRNDLCTLNFRTRKRVCTTQSRPYLLHQDRHGISLLRIMQSRLRGALSTNLMQLPNHSLNAISFLSPFILITQWFQPTANNDDPLRSLLEHHRQIMKSSTALLLFRHRSASQRMAFSVM